MPKFIYSDKEKKNEYLPLLFDIFYENTKDISPFSFSYEIERAEWIKEVWSALEKEPRKIILCYDNSELAGFLMYYTREDMLMIEEIQLKKKYQRTRLLYQLCAFLKSVLPESIDFIEAYADKRNTASISLQQKLGMEITNESPRGLYHLRGEIIRIKSRIK